MSHTRPFHQSRSPHCPGFLLGLGGPWNPLVGEAAPRPPGRSLPGREGEGGE